MHDTVSKIRKLIKTGEPSVGVAENVSERLQASGLSRALAEPLASHLDQLYTDALRWTKTAIEAGELPAEEPVQPLFVRLWDLETGDVIHHLAAHPGRPARG